jgi:N utilization substance protein B
MKTSLDPRHIKREKAIKALFSSSFGQKSKKNKLANQIIKKIGQIDKIITQNAPEWPLKQINKVDLAILRLALYELIIKPNEPPKVIIDEAVELGKKYGSESTPSFINGVLGAILNEKA